MSKNKNNKENIDSFIQNTLQNIRKLIDANVIVGNPIQAGTSTQIIPINKVTVGYITGGGEITNKKAPHFSVASTSGFNIVPMGFIFVSNNEAGFVSAQTNSPNDKIFEALFKVINKKMNEQSGVNNEE